MQPWAWALLWLAGAALAPAPASAARRKDEGFNVLGGEDVAADELDYVVGISIRQKNSRSTSSCSGCIISNRWVLTAGHCVATARPSTHDVLILAGAKRLSQARSIPAEKWFSYELYRESENPTLAFYDIGLVKLQEPVTRIPNTAIAILPSLGESPPSYGSTVTIAGFGIEGEENLATSRRGVLKKADMVVSGQCTNTYPYCIRAVARTGRSCSGDSGGPMVYRGKVVGVSSTGRTCSTRRGDAQYTAVSVYVSWILDKINRR